MMIPKDCEFVRPQEQFNVKRKRLYEPVKQSRNNRRFFETIPDSTNAVTGHFHRVTAASVRLDIVVADINRRAGSLVLTDFDV